MASLYLAPLSSHKDDKQKMSATEQASGMAFGTFLAVWEIGTVPATMYFWYETYQSHASLFGKIVCWLILDPMAGQVWPAVVTLRWLGMKP